MRPPPVWWAFALLWQLVIVERERFAKNDLLTPFKEAIKRFFKGHGFFKSFNLK